MTRAPLGLAAALAAALELVGCQPIGFLTDLQSDIKNAQTQGKPPGIVPAGGVFRTPPSITISGEKPQDRIFFTVDGTAPRFGARGQPFAGTYSALNSPLFVPSGLIYATGQNTLRALSWNGVKSSPEAQATFYVNLPGSVTWNKAGLGGNRGQVLSVASLGGGAVTVGWTLNGLGQTVGTLARWDSSGTITWLGTVQGGLTASGAVVNGVAVDASGNTYAVGTLSPSGSDTFTFGTNNLGVMKQLSGVATKRGFLVKYDNAGFCQWVASLESSVLLVSANAVAYSNGQGKAIVVGTAYGASGAVKYFDGDSPSNFQVVSGQKVASSGPQANGFLVSYNPSGTALAPGYSSGSADGADEFLSVSVDESVQYTAVGGRFRLNAGATLNYGGPDGLQGGSVPLLQWNALLLHFSTASLSTPLHVRGTVFGSGDSAFLGVAVKGAVTYAAGYQNGASPRYWGWNTSTLTPQNGWAGPSGAENALVVAYSMSTSPSPVAWVAGTNTGSPSQLNGLMVGGGGDLFAAGRLGSGSTAWSTNPAVAVVSGPWTGSSGRTGFFTRLSAADGSAVWGRVTDPGSADTELYALTHDGTSSPENLILGGATSGTASQSWGTGISASGSASGDNVLLLQAYD